jgi:hypothetical protein
VLQADPSVGTGVQLVIGPGYSSVVPVQVSPPSAAGTSAAPTAAAAKPKAAASCG